MSRALRYWIVCTTTLLIAAGCGGMMAAAPQGENGEECKLSSGGEMVCGYHCMMQSDGQVKCADTPDGSCQFQASGDVVCTQMAAAEPAPVASTPAQPAPAATDGGGATSTTTSASCCVNGAYYACPDGGAVAMCLGEPMALMSCLQECPMASGMACENQCAADHGPRPDEAGCERTPSRDGECSR